MATEFGAGRDPTDTCEKKKCPKNHNIRLLPARLHVAGCQLNNLLDATGGNGRAHGTVSLPNVLPDRPNNYRIPAPPEMEPLATECEPEPAVGSLVARALPPGRQTKTENRPKTDAHRNCTPRERRPARRPPKRKEKGSGGESKRSTYRRVPQAPAPNIDQSQRASINDQFRMANGATPFPVLEMYIYLNLNAKRPEKPPKHAKIGRQTALEATVIISPLNVNPQDVSVVDATPPRCRNSPLPPVAPKLLPAGCARGGGAGPVARGVRRKAPPPMSFSSNDTLRPLALQRSHSLPHLTNSREDSGVALSASGSCSGLHNLGYGSDGSGTGSGRRLHHRHHHHHHHRHHDLKIPYGARLVADLRQLITLKQHYYPEGGWGWLVTYIGIVVNCIAHGLQLSAGVFLLQTGTHIFPHLTVAAASQTSQDTDRAGTSEDKAQRTKSEPNRVGLDSPRWVH
uniref:Monocarboxylate transporter n=1 Tax=Anopheles farauti TaxID=69004 RepID=A0A182QM13_9DIPT